MISQRYISQIDMSTDVIEKNNSDLLSGTYPIKVMAYKVDTPLSISTMGNGNNALNYTIELHIGEREKIGQGTFGKVYKAKLLTTQEIVAIKEVEMEEKFKS
ncbi:unnamed protein product, partial [Adineta steineri]